MFDNPESTNAQEIQTFLVVYSVLQTGAEHLVQWSKYAFYKRERKTKKVKDFQPCEN